MTFVILALIFAFATVLLWLLSRPVSARMPLPDAHPAVSYTDALNRIDFVHQAESCLSLNDVCHTALLTHGAPTEHVILLLHGYTNCPEQFMELGELFFALGYNVYLPRLPQHGMADRLTDALRGLTAEELVAAAARDYDIARGLGQKVTVMGISAGGTLTNWLAQYRQPDFAVPIAAMQGIGILPGFLNRPFTHLFLALPFFYVWWDPRTGIKNPYAIEYSYPRYSFQNLAHMLRIAAWVDSGARQNPPGSARILTVNNDFDPGVSRPKQQDLSRLWQKWIGTCASELHFERSLHWLHDIITPHLPDDPTPQVYARLIQAVQQLHGQAVEQGDPL